MTTQILNHLPDELLHGVQAVDQFVHAPVDTLKERGRAVEAALRDRFGGYDKSLTKESLRKRQLERYRALFDLLDDKGGWLQWGRVAQQVQRLSLRRCTCPLPCATALCNACLLLPVQAAEPCQSTSWRTASEKHTYLKRGRRCVRPAVSSN